MNKEELSYNNMLLFRVFILSCFRDSFFISDIGVRIFNRELSGLLVRRQHDSGAG